MSEIYSPSKNRKFYTIKQGLAKIFFTFGKKRKIIHDLFYMTLASKIYHFFASRITLFIVKNFSYDFFSNNKLLRIMLFSGIRGMSLKEIFKIRNLHFNKIIKNDEKIELGYKKIVDEIRKNGFAKLDDEFLNISSKEIEDVNMYFRNSYLYDGHDPLQSSLKKLKYSELNKHQINHQIFNKGYFSYDVETSLNNKLISSLFYNPKLKKLADCYCGFETEPYTISTMLNVKKEIVHPVTEFHRDTDDFIALGFFIYWSKTNRDNGATSYKIGSHMKIESSDFKTNILEVDAGTLIAGDWMGLHSGNSKMEDNERLITMIRFGKKINQSYMQTKSYYFF